MREPLCKSTAALFEWQKSSLCDLFCRNRFLLFAALTVEETCKEALLRKASEPTAHVAGFGTIVRGQRPSDTSQKVYRQAGAAGILPAAFFV